MRFYLERSILNYSYVQVVYTILSSEETENREEESYVVYRYFTTIIYVAIAYIKGLTREINNYKTVYYFIDTNK